VRYRGLLYRALNPIWARQPLSGDGARLHGGRFNPKGRAALYASLTPLTAIREANRAGAFQPVTLVCYRADLDPVLDARDPAALAAHGATTELVADDAWRLRMTAAGMAPTQALADRLIAAGFAGMLVRSFAPGATPADLNLVLWRWGAEPPAALSVIDDEGRLA
jgi:RES domain-containing protein